MRSRLAAFVALGVIAMLAAGSGAVAGQQPDAGEHTANPQVGQGGNFKVSSDKQSVEWVDGREYAWHMSPPPPGNGYYQFGTEELYVTFLLPIYEWTQGYGTYN